MLNNNNCTFISIKYPQNKNDSKILLDYGDFELPNLFGKSNSTKNKYELGIANVLASNSGILHIIHDAPIQSWKDISWLSQILFHAPYELHQLHNQYQICNPNIHVHKILKESITEMITTCNNAFYNQPKTTDDEISEFAILFINENKQEEFNDLCEKELNKNVKIYISDWWFILRNFWETLYPYIYKTNYEYSYNNGCCNHVLTTLYSASEPNKRFPCGAMLSESASPLLDKTNNSLPKPMRLSWFDIVKFNSNLFYNGDGIGIPNMESIIMWHQDEKHFTKFQKDKNGNITINKITIERPESFDWQWDDKYETNELWIEIHKDFPKPIWNSIIQYFEYQTKLRNSK